MRVQSLTGGRCVSGPRGHAFLQPGPAALVLAAPQVGKPSGQGHRLVGSAQLVGWDQRRFAAPAHQDFSMFSDGGPALEACWSHPTLKQAMALPNGPVVLLPFGIIKWIKTLPQVRRTVGPLGLKQ